MKSMIGVSAGPPISALQTENEDRFWKTDSGMLQSQTESWSYQKNSATPNLDHVIASIHVTMSSTHGKLRSGAPVWNLTGPHPIMPNGTRSSAKCAMLKRFFLMKDELLLLRNNEHGDLQMDRTMRFWGKITKIWQHACGDKRCHSVSANRSAQTYLSADRIPNHFKNL